MSENRHEKCSNVTLEGLHEDNCCVSKDELNKLAYKHVRVEEGEAFVPAAEYEVMEVEHFLAETKYENVLEDKFFYMNSADTEKYLTLEDFPSPDELGISNSDSTRSPGEFMDSMLQDREEDQCLGLLGNLSSDYPDYLLDSGFAGKSSHLHDDLHGRYCLRNLCSDYSKTLEVDSDVDETLNLTKSINPKTDGVSDQNTLYPDDTSILEPHDVFRNTCRQGASNADKQRLKQQILSGLGSLRELDATSDDLKSRLLLDENEDMIVLFTKQMSEASCASLMSTADHKTSVVKSLSDRFADKNAVSDCNRLPDFEGRDHALVTRKRTRKPTRRYIEESSEAKTRVCTENLGSFSIIPQDKILQVRAHNVLWKRSGSTQMICSEKSSTLSCSQMYIVQPRRGRPRKNCTLVKDIKCQRGYINAVEHKTVCGSVTSISENEDDVLDFSPTAQSDKCGVRRKHHRSWTLSEVTKLIEGVSRYGVGRWTEIKRLLFSSSAYRTSVDLKDKWRNLLKASGAHMHGKKEVDTKRKHLPGLVPQSILRRVRDLAIMHPYPRERKTRAPLSALIPANGKGIPCSRRMMHRSSMVPSSV
uniref:Telomere repeat-binding protein 6 n=1 Tax=Anthurium amnicola TaxID=1678845 RepID=A0A1D1Y2X0_9ARAE